MPVLAKEEMERFLTDPGILMRIGVNRVDGFPLVTPIWFIYREHVFHAKREVGVVWLSETR